MANSPVTAGSADTFTTGGGALPDIGELTAALWASGDSRPEWCWVGTAGGRTVARVGFRVVEDPADPPPAGTFEPELLRTAWRCVPYTVGLFGLAFAPGPEGVAAAAGLLRAAVGALAPGTVVQALTNPEAHTDHVERRELFALAGFALFQEKQGYGWSAAGGVPSADLALRPVSAVGEAEFLAVLAGAGGHTLDRNDRFYYARCGPGGWARVMLSLLEPGSRDTWCLGYAASDAPVGFVAVSPFDEPGTATVAHIGVLPAHRGHGYGRRLLAAGTALAAGAGYTATLSDVDVENGPMRAAMLATGHRDDVRPWHVWHHRLTR